MCEIGKKFVLMLVLGSFIMLSVMQKDGIVKNDVVITGPSIYVGGDNS